MRDHGDTPGPAPLAAPDTRKRLVTAAILCGVAIAALSFAGGFWMKTAATQREGSAPTSESAQGETGGPRETSTAASRINELERKVEQLSTRIDELSKKVEEHASEAVLSAITSELARDRTDINRLTEASLVQSDTGVALQSQLTALFNLLNETQRKINSMESDSYHSSRGRGSAPDENAQ